MKALIGLSAALVSVSASAQTTVSNTGMNSPSYGVDQLGYNFGMGLSETPTMKRQKLARALKLRDEAGRLLAKDGGTLSVDHVRYIQKKAKDILGNTSG